MIICGRRWSRPQPPNPGEPVPSAPPIGKAAGAPLRYGGLRAAPALHIFCHIIYCIRTNNRGQSPSQRRSMHFLIRDLQYWCIKPSKTSPYPSSPKTLPPTTMRLSQCPRKRVTDKGSSSLRSSISYISHIMEMEIITTTL